MLNFAADGDSGADVMPGGSLADGKEVAGAQLHVGSGVAIERATQLDRSTFRNGGGIADSIMGQIRLLRVRAALEPTRSVDEILNPHVAGKRKFSGPRDFTLDGDRWRIDLRKVAMDEEAVARENQNVFRRLTGHGAGQIHAKNAHASIGFRAEKLCGFQV